MSEKINIYNPGDGPGRAFRMKILKRWSKNGGVVLISDSLFRTSMRSEDMAQMLSKPDAIVLDERSV